MQEQLTCPYCKTPIEANFIFCPTCGIKISEANAPISIGKQLSIYFISIFLPPFGLVPGFRYALGKNQKARKVGAIAIILTLLSSAITIWYTISILGDISQSVQSQTQQYKQQLGI